MFVSGDTLTYIFLYFNFSFDLIFFVAKLNAKKESDTNAHSCKLHFAELKWQTALLSFHFFSFFIFLTSGFRKKSLVPAEKEMDVWLPFLFDYTQLCRVILDEKGPAFSQITCNGELQKFVCNCMCPPPTPFPIFVFTLTFRRCTQRLPSAQAACFP